MLRRASMRYLKIPFNVPRHVAAGATVSTRFASTVAANTAQDCAQR
ncbi:hypothetical protein K788_0002454 [Paraburkholderia caribensis MBA4]|uniref:Uncharacterized protein n=1 Tax=Paraburkholderia caribensis MBA4 TaxID=1323664 RepID=A0A0N7JTZ0_9BURK|nr:hypothetical protein K788_0002454 [Paraburkholderia caribensis MBA4]